jgi:hypothetical protein
MTKSFLLQLTIIINFIFIISCSEHNIGKITPNQFKGTDVQRIQSAIDAAKGTTNTIVIPSVNSNGTSLWLLDSAILLPSNMTVILENCTVQLSDNCRDNMFRSDNVGIGITDPEWNNNISIIGIGDVTFKGANNPRATGDSNKKLSLKPGKDIKKFGNWRITYGTDAGKKGLKQTGDWRNIMILMAYVNGFKLKNVTIENSHAWAISHERVINAEISDIRFNIPERMIINGENQLIRNRDGIDLRHGCKNFRIDNISGVTGDDLIALSTLGLYSENTKGGTLNSTMVTSRIWRGCEDATEQIIITNISCQSPTRAVAIRANDIAGINNVYIDGVIFAGGHNAILAGGKGYGKESQPGKINNIHAMNIIGNGRSLILIEEAIADCSFMDGLYWGGGDQIIIYNIDKNKPRNIVSQGLIKMKE